MNKIMSYILMILIAILYTSIIFYGSQVFFNTEENKCWEKYNYPMTADKNYDDLAVKEQEKAMQNEIEKCNTLYLENKINQEKYKLLFIGILNILILLLILFVKIKNIDLGLFLGVIISSIIAIIAYYNSSSIVVFGLIVIEFVLCLLQITKKFKG